MTNVFEDYKKQRRETDEFGFKWNNYQQIIKQIKSECDEVADAIEKGDKAHIQEEIGDLIHAALDLAYQANFDIEQTIYGSIKKFDRRLQSLKATALREGYKTLDGLPIEQILAFWDEVKKQERVST